MQYYATQVIVGADNNTHDQVVLSYFKPPHNLHNSSDDWIVWITKASNNPQMRVKKEDECIQITESLPGGGKKYVTFRRSSTGKWSYITGEALSHEDGWVTQGSSTSHGWVVFDQSRILDEVLEYFRP